jgi:hypothetical protein
MSMRAACGEAHPPNRGKPHRRMEILLEAPYA